MAMLGDASRRRAERPLPSSAAPPGHLETEKEARGEKETTVAAPQLRKLQKMKTRRDSLASQRPIHPFKAAGDVKVGEAFPVTSGCQRREGLPLFRAAAHPRRARRNRSAD